ncbi:hypothetical protein VL04_20120 [Chromobacterium violaceum]|uniref:oxygen-regulated invasion protein OrgA n=1 Tax=Chromobacterium violaceum TaxID=536 RepID=UPI000652EA93|nr:oxygen-regulated invasion protein OrgA [Chromobacterium violaceum]KMN49770.1 hypothetical protein VK93_09220 [Chromobacterium violaceum]KMN87912.1 hypothetical protein VL02_01110 [Chromobacterium violaceum]KMN88496.1 hypothetical protein VL04_20120 [Chromobacterium violaceum]KMO05515.1 hypothetical protein VL16_03095 [Chromobacterium violaceum]
MAKQAVQLRALLFDPLSYLHRDRLRLPPALAGAEQRRLVNDMLIAGYRLRTDWSPDPADRSHGLWLAEWRRLPQAAYLMGCQLLRARLAARGGLLRLPGWARGFAAMQIGAEWPAAPLDEAPGHDAILLAGFGQLLSWRERMPEALAQRLPLLFPAWVDEASPCIPAQNTLLLTLALQYAKRHPHFPPSERD